MPSGCTALASLPVPETQLGVADGCRPAGIDRERDIPGLIALAVRGVGEADCRVIDAERAGLLAPRIDGERYMSSTSSSPCRSSTTRLASSAARKLNSSAVPVLALSWY